MPARHFSDGFSGDKLKREHPANPAPSQKFAGCRTPLKVICSSPSAGLVLSRNAGRIAVRAEVIGNLLSFDRAVVATVQAHAMDAGAVVDMVVNIAVFSIDEVAIVGLSRGRGSRTGERENHQKSTGDFSETGHDYNSERKMLIAKPRGPECFRRVVV